MSAYEASETSHSAHSAIRTGERCSSGLCMSSSMAASQARNMTYATRAAT